MSVFSTRLKELRNKANLSQQELSKIIGISKSSINMYERGEREPGLETVGALADYFDVQTDYLLGKHDDKRSLKDGRKYNRLMLQAVEDYRKLHEYTREQMELLLDWNNFYADMEEERTLGDAGMLKVIQNILLVLDSELPDKQELPPEEPKLSEGEQLLLELFRKIPEDRQEFFLDMVRGQLGKKE